MGLIDTTELLFDPDFVDALTLIRRVPSVDSFGQSSTTDTPFATIGSIQPITGKAAQRLPEELQFSDVRSFWIKATIQTDGSGIYPDLISWNGENYAIKIVFAWTNWGAGWCEGVCVREVPAP